MRKLIIATTALAFLSSTVLVPSVAFAQDKATTPAAKNDTMSKGKMSKMSKTKKTTKHKKMAAPKKTDANSK